MKAKSIWIVTLLTPLVGLLSAGPAFASEQLISAFSLPMQVNATVNETGCNNSPGPQVTIEGEIVLGGVLAKLTFKNNKKGTHITNVVAEYTVSLIPEGGTIIIPKQPVQGGVGGNPHIWLQFHDGEGNNLSSEFYLGRCVQGLEVSAEMLNEALMQADVESGACSNKNGPFINLSGEIELSGLHARLIFRNNKKGTHTAEDTADVALILNGSSIKLPKQPSRGGVGGNPLIEIQFLHENGDPIGDPVLLGRCNQI